MERGASDRSCPQVCRRRHCRQTRSWRSRQKRQFIHPSSRPDEIVASPTFHHTEEKPRRSGALVASTQIGVNHAREPYTGRRRCWLREDHTLSQKLHSCPRRAGSKQFCSFGLSVAQRIQRSGGSGTIVALFESQGRSLAHHLLIVGVATTIMAQRVLLSRQTWR